MIRVREIKAATEADATVNQQNKFLTLLNGDSASALSRTLISFAFAASFWSEDDIRTKLVLRCPTDGSNCRCPGSDLTVPEYPRLNCLAIVVLDRAVQEGNATTPNRTTHLTMLKTIVAVLRALTLCAKKKTRILGFLTQKILFSPNRNSKLPIGRALGSIL